MFKTLKRNIEKKGYYGMDSSSLDFRYFWPITEIHFLLVNLKRYELYLQNINRDLANQAGSLIMKNPSVYNPSWTVNNYHCHRRKHITIICFSIPYLLVLHVYHSLSGLRLLLCQNQNRVRLQVVVDDVQEAIQTCAKIYTLVWILDIRAFLHLF